MKNIKVRIFIYFITILISTTYLIYRYCILKDASDFQKEFLVNVAITFIITAIMGIYEFAKNNSANFWLTIKCWILIPNRKVYVSLSYLIRIKLPGCERYLLVKGSKIEQYQPVGGVYKLAGNKDIFKDWRASIKQDKNNPKDLRFFINAKYLPDVIKWFKSGKDREVGVWREFYEELIENRILGSKNFKHISAEYLYTKEKLLTKQTRFNNETYHALMYDVFKIELSHTQLEELIRLEENETFTKKYAFVTEDEISKECFNDSKTRIGQHTKYLI